MSKRNEIDIKEDVLELKKILRKCQNIKEEKRIKLFVILQESPTMLRKDLCKKLNMDISTVKRLIIRYKTEGIQLVFSDRKRKKQSKIITTEMHKGIEKRVLNKKTPFLSYVDAVNWVEEEYGVKVNYHNLRKYMKSKFGTKIKSPRRSHVMKDPKAEDAFLKTS